MKKFFLVFAFLFLSYNTAFALSVDKDFVRVFDDVIVIEWNETGESWVAISGTNEAPCSGAFENSEGKTSPFNFQAGATCDFPLHIMKLVYPLNFEEAQCFQGNFEDYENCLLSTDIPEYLGQEFIVTLGTNGVRFLSVGVQNGTTANLSANVSNSVGSVFPIALLSIGIFLAFYIIQRVILFFNYDKKR